MLSLSSTHTQVSQQQQQVVVQRQEYKESPVMRPQQMSAPARQVETREVIKEVIKEVCSSHKSQHIVALLSCIPRHSRALSCENLVRISNESQKCAHLVALNSVYTRY